jgi:Xaa-Pro aminopeptidase
MGSMQLASLVFPFDVPMNSIDVLARSPLWEAGLNYLHGTGHGVGAFLSVHEGEELLPGLKVLYDSEDLVMNQMLKVDIISLILRHYILLCYNIKKKKLNHQ